MCSAVVEQPIAFVNHTTSVTVANLNYASYSSPCSMTIWRYCRVHGYNFTHSRMRNSFVWTSVQRPSSKRVRQIEIRIQRHALQLKLDALRWLLRPFLGLKTSLEVFALVWHVNRILIRFMTTRMEIGFHRHRRFQQHPGNRMLVAYWLKHWIADWKVQGSSPTSSRDLFLFWV